MSLETRRAVRLLASAAVITLAAVPAQAEPARAAPSGAPERHLEVASIDPAIGGRPADKAGAPTEAERGEPRPDVDLGRLREAIDVYRQGDIAGGDAIKATMTEPAARALLDWLAIRSGAALAFDRVVDFLRDYPDWPTSVAWRRRAEETLLANRRPASVVRAFFAATKPVSASGKLALALAFKGDGLDRDAAELVRDAWRNDTFGHEFEVKILENFSGVLTQADHRFRMERFLFKENWGGATRAAGYAGKDYLALVKARMAVDRRSPKAAAALAAVPAALRSDTSYIFSRAQFLRHKDKVAEAVKALEGVTLDPETLVDGDQWWVERRMLARKLLDQGDAKDAYRIAREHGAQSNAQKIEAEFHAGWIALRFLDDPGTAAEHFSRAAEIAETPISVARAAYWQGRAAEAAGAQDNARQHYERAAQHAITYYGQLARAKLGYTNLPLRAATDHDPQARAAFARSLPVQAVKLLYAAGVPNLATPLCADLSQRLSNPMQLDVLGQIVAENRDARSLLALGKIAVQKGMPLDLHAYPTIGIPAFEPVGARVEKAMVYAIARQESAFDPKAQSGVGARGLMQLMPATAQRTAQRFGINYNVDKLVEDPAYNAKLGSAHLGELMEDWKGSYILTFASYNAGGGNVKKWINAYGDPRKPEVDPVDWIERIPFSETRNYVQRVMENLQVYRRRLEERSALLFDKDLRQGPSVQ